MVMATSKSAQYLLTDRFYPEELLIYSNSQVSIRSINNQVSTSYIVNKCRDFLREISDHLTLLWVPGQSDFIGNRIAIELTRAGKELAISECYRA